MPPSISLSNGLHLQSIEAKQNLQIWYYASARTFVVVGVLNVSAFLMIFSRFLEKFSPVFDIGDCFSLTGWEIHPLTPEWGLELCMS